jgi:hypothetical protein
MILKCPLMGGIYSNVGTGPTMFEEGNLKKLRANCPILWWIFEY